MNCGNEVGEGAKFCSKCGSKVNAEEKKTVFNLKKRKMVGRLVYKVTSTEITDTGVGLNIKQNIHKFFGRDKQSDVSLKYPEIASVEMKTKMDFWDTLYAVVFGVIYLFDMSNIVLLLFIALFLYTGYGKVMNLKLKNGMDFEIPVEYATEDAVNFQKLIEYKR